MKDTGNGGSSCMQEHETSLVLRSCCLTVTLWVPFCEKHREDDLFRVLDLAARSSSVPFPIPWRLLCVETTLGVQFTHLLGGSCAQRRACLWSPSHRCQEELSPAQLFGKQYSKNKGTSATGHADSSVPKSRTPCLGSTHHCTAREDS